MTDQKRPGETFESFAERRIREAQAEGAFDGLPGFGRPIHDIDEPHDENRWLRKKLKREQIQALPPILEARLDIERTRERLDTLQSETQVRQSLNELNARIRRAHFSTIPGPAGGVSPVDVDAEVHRWKQRVSARDV